MKKLEKNFYKQNTLDIAKQLLGKYLIYDIPKGRIICRIVEVEAYIGPDDKGSHSYMGKRTPRNETMYHEGGTAYVYIIYGMYNCLNVVTSDKDKPEAVLIRAVEPVCSLDILSQNRFKKDYDELTKKQILNLTSGPGKLCIAMEITKDNNGMDLCGEYLYICRYENEDNNDFDIVCAKRIGIDYAEEAKDYLWRFYIKDNPYVSKP